MALSDATRQQVKARGYTDAEITRFLSENPGDEGRILSAFPGQGGSAPSSPTSGGGGAMEGLAAAGDPIGGIPPDVPKSGLTGLSAGEAAFSGGLGGQETAVSKFVPGGGAGQLRQSLGQRIYPQGDSALAGLRRIY